MNRIINLALSAWLDRLEALEDSFPTPGGYLITKPAGKAYPQRLNDGLRQGPPLKSEREELSERSEGAWANSTARLEVPIYDRFLNAVFWRRSLRSRDADQAIREWLDELEGGAEALDV